MFTDPEIAWAGLTEEQAKAEGIAVEVVRYPWAASGRAQALGRTEGFTKLLIDPDSERILGVGIVGVNAGDMITEGVVAIEMGATARDVAESIHPHPTLSETLGNAAEVFLGTATEIYRPRRRSSTRPDEASTEDCQNGAAPHETYSPLPKCANWGIIRSNRCQALTPPSDLDPPCMSEPHSTCNGVWPMAQADTIPSHADPDPLETAEWLESLRSVLENQGPERVSFLLTELSEAAHREGVELPFTANTPYINTIPADKQPPYPGNREIERRIKSIIRWNAMAMVTRANKANDGIGGHISTFASAATLYEVAFNHFFRGKGDDYSGDQIYFQGHASPGMYARAFLEGRMTKQHLVNFRQELAAGGGLSSYPHPWLMPNFWEFPTVSMGLGPIMAIYQARFNKYLQDRGIKQTERPARLGLPRRRRIRRARNAGRDHAGRARGARQPDLRHQLQLAAARRPGARQRQDHSGAGRRLPRRRLERDQGHLGRQLGSAAGQGQARPAGQADGRGRRRRISEVHRHARRVHSRALLRQVSRAGADGPRTCRTKS